MICDLTNDSNVYVTGGVTQSVSSLYTLHHPGALLHHLSSVCGRRGRGQWRQRAEAGASLVPRRLYGARDELLPVWVLDHQTPKLFRLVFHGRNSVCIFVTYTLSSQLSVLFPSHVVGFRDHGRYRQFCPLATDWTAWLPGTCQVGRLVRHPGGPPRQMVK